MSGRRMLGLVLIGLVTLTGCGVSRTAVSSLNREHISPMTIAKSMTSQFTTSSSTPPSLSEIQFVSNGEGFAVASLGQESAVLHTSDGGRSWQPRYVAPVVLGLSIATNKVGWLTTCSRSGCQTGTSLETTTDGGHTWRTVYHAPANTTLGTPDFVNATTGWMVESNTETMKNLLWYSSNGGKTWTPSGTIPQLFPGKLGSVMDFIDPATGWLLLGGEPGAGSQTKALYQTTNGGQTWTKIAASAILGSSSTSDNLAVGGYVDALDFVNRTLGYMAFARGPIYRTTDGGHHWSPVWLTRFPPDIVTGQSLAFSSARAGYVLAEPGGTLWQTTDGGTHWAALYPPVMPNGSVSFATQKVGAGLALAGNSSTVMTTQNGGKTWSIASRPSMLLGSLEWGANRTLWGVGVGVQGAIYQSHDMGRNFQRISLPRSYVAQSLSVTSTHDVMAVVSSRTGVPDLASLDDKGHWQILSLPFAPREATEPALNNIWAMGTPLKATEARQRYQDHHTNPKTVKLYDIRHPLILYLYHTVNGHTWVRYQLPAGLTGRLGFPIGLTFLNRQFGYFWNQRALCITQNGGKTWNIQTVPSNIGIQWVNFISPTEGWLTPAAGTPIYHTTTGGKTWSS